MTMPLKVASVAVFLQHFHGQPPDYAAALSAVCKNVPRRLTRFIQLNLIGAHQCVNRARGPLTRDCGVYLGSAKGNTEDAINLLRQVFQVREIPNPVTFINSSTNVASYYLAQTLKLHGRNLAIASSDFSFEAALELACLDVGDAAVPMGLVGAVDQSSDQRWVDSSAPADRGAPGALDLSVWLLIDPACPNPLAEIQWIRRANGLEEAQPWIDPAGERNLPGYLALGRGVLPGEKRLLGERCSSGWSTYSYAEDIPDVEVLAAYGIGRFILAGNPGRLLHIAGNGRGSFYGVCLTVPRSADDALPA